MSDNLTSPEEYLEVVTAIHAAIVAAAGAAHLAYRSKTVCLRALCDALDSATTGFTKENE